MTDKRSLTEEIATRERRGDYASFMSYLPNPDPVLKKQGKDISVYKELRTDAHAGAEILKRKSGVQALEYRLNGEDKRALSLGQEIIDALKMHKTITEIVDAPLYGYKPMEVLWEKRGGLLFPSLCGKPSDWFRFDQDNNLLFLSRNNMNGEKVKDYKFIVAKNDADYENPYGFPVLSSCFWPVVFKRGGWKFWVKFVEKYGMPWVIGKYARGSKQNEIDGLLDNLDAMVEDAVGAIPDDARVDIVESASKGASSDLYERLLKFGNAEVSKAIVGQTLTTELGSGGSYAASQTHKQVLEDIVRSDAKIIEETFNTLLEWAVKLNLGTNAKPPKFEMFEKDDVSKEQSERDKNLSEVGVQYKKSYFMRNYGFKEDEIEVSKTETPQKNGQQFSENDPRKKPADILDAKRNPLDTKAIEAQLLEEVMHVLAKAESFEDAQETLLEAYPLFDASVLEKMLEELLEKSYLLGAAEVGYESK